MPAEPTGLFRLLAKTSEEEKAVIEHQRQYRFSELVMHLPADWPTSGDAMQQHQYAWPFLWLKTIARYPHEQRTWLGGPITIFAASDPPEPLAENTQLAAFMLAAKTEMTCKDDTLIQFFTVVPIYAEERELEMREGLPALLNKLDENGIGDTVDLERLNVGAV